MDLAEKNFIELDVPHVFVNDRLSAEVVILPMIFAGRNPVFIFADVAESVVVEDFEEIAFTFPAHYP